MEFLHRSNAATRSVALLPGAWNPPTRAHIAMARAALEWSEESVLVLPRALPHKEFKGAPFEQRAAWIRRVAEADGLSAAVSDGGLFIELARECRAALGPLDVYLVCGRDAAERIVNWNYGAGDSIHQQLEEYQLLVSPRGGPYIPPPELAARVHHLNLGASWEDVSSTDVRERIRRGDPWAHLVPESIAGEQLRPE